MVKTNQEPSCTRNRGAFSLILRNLIKNELFSGLKDAFNVCAFILSPNVRLVRGQVHSAVFEFTTERVFWVNASVANFLEFCSSPRQFEELMSFSTLNEKQIYELITSLVHYNILKAQSSQIPIVENYPLNYDELPLEQVWAELTLQCNLKCVHCYANAQNELLKPLPLSFWESAFQQINEKGCSLLQLTGGEPFLHPQFWEIAEVARKILPDSQIEIFSNGTLITPEIASKIAKLGFQVAISVHGYTEDVHESITCVSGSFQKVLNGLQALQEANISTRTECIVLDSSLLNLNFVSNYISFIKSKYTNIKVGPPRPALPIGRLNKTLCPPENNPLQVPRFLINHTKFLENTSINPCWGRRCAILANGDLVPCIFARNLKFGSLKSNSLNFKQLFLKQDFRMITKTQVSICQDCEFRFLCHDCRALASAICGSLYSGSPSCAYDPQKGTWKTSDMPTMTNSSPDIILLKNHSFTPLEKL
ncbi:MAG: radical SAM protein [Promethearchaeota archaeon]